MALTQVSTKGIKDGTILNDDINASASIAGTKISPDFGSQNIVTTGNGGIGTTNPQQRLHLHTASSSAANMVFSNTTTGSGASDGFVVGLDGAERGQIFNQENTDLIFGTNNQERMRIDASGNVGIGTDSPNSFSNYKTLTIQGGSSGSGIDLELDSGDIHGRFFGDTNGVQIQSTQAGDSIRFETAGANERMRIDENGNVGIGTTSPAYHLDVIGDGGGAFSASSNSTQGQLSIVGKNSGGSVSAISRLKSYPDGSSNQSHLAFETRDSSNNMVEAMRITSNQKIGIGTTSPVGKLHLYEASNDPYIYIQRGSGDTAATLGGIFWKNNTNGLGLIDVRSDDINDGRMRFYTMGAGTLTERVRLESGGNLKILDGDLVIGASGHGIDFSDTSHAGGMTSELLDDYEIGTWTPVLGSDNADPTQSYNTQNGTYVKIGNFVHLQFDIRMAASGISGGSGNCMVDGLPFPMDNSLQTYGMQASFGFTRYWGGENPTGGYINAGSSSVYLMDRSTGDGDNYVNAVQVTNDTRLLGSFAYRTHV